ncbi:MAG: Si-specific NAD(P)(+) transhydrogenase [Isosphaeraceae bacterium]
MEPLSYDLVVIGSGPAGEHGATTAASFGKRVALIEKSSFVGGASTNTGTLPSKTLRETALAISGLRARDLYGVDLSLRREATVADFMFHERRVTANERDRVDQGLRRRDITVHHGTASFVDPHTLRVVPAGVDPASRAGDGLLIRGEFVLIATGSSPAHPPGFPFEHDRVHDSDEVLQLARLPRSMAVVGAGVIGCEYACTFAALGTRVWIVDGRNELLPFLDQEVSRALETAMHERLGIEFLWGTKVVGCDAPAEGEITLSLEPGSVLKADSVLVAAGRTSNTASLNLQAAGLCTGPRGLVVVDHFYRTAVPHIYAAGDVIGFPALASTSAKQARIAMTHAFYPASHAELSPILPAGIYSIPEVAMVGAAEEDLKARGIDYVVGRAYYAESARGEIIGDSTGFLKLIFQRSDMALLGVHVLGEQATELVHIGLMGMLTRSTAEVFTRACFNFPTLGDLYQDAAEDALNQRAAGVVSS